MTEPEFEPFGKIPRLNRDILITEKIDGTNAQVCIVPNDDGTFTFRAGSRNRWITPEDDNAGFARWAYGNADALIDLLGPGRHYGEWWGSGIQRGYGLSNGDKRFSLFNGVRWAGIEKYSDGLVTTAPVLYQGVFEPSELQWSIDRLRNFGSLLVDGYMNPEGIVIYHSAAKQAFKVTLENDAVPKAVAEFDKTKWDASQLVTLI